MANQPLSYYFVQEVYQAPGRWIVRLPEPECSAQGQDVAQEAFGQVDAGLRSFQGQQAVQGPGTGHSASVHRSNGPWLALSVFIHIESLLFHGNLLE